MWMTRIRMKGSRRERQVRRVVALIFNYYMQTTEQLRSFNIGKSSACCFRVKEILRRDDQRREETKKREKSRKEKRREEYHFSVRGSRQEIANKYRILSLTDPATQRARIVAIRQRCREKYSSLSGVFPEILLHRT